MRKPAIVLIHGFRGSPLGLQKIADVLAADFEVFVPAIPPFGGAEALDEYSVEGYVQYILNEIEERGLEKPILVGHSMGSIIASAVAARAPEKINQKLVLMSPIAKKTPSFVAGVEPFIMVLPNRAMSFISTQFLFASDDKEIYDDVLEITNKCGEKFTTRSDVLAAAKFSSNHAISDFASELGQEILFLCGAKDRLMPVRKTQKLAEEMGAKTKVQIIHGTGHLMNYEKPEETATAIRDFVSKGF